ncbi:heparan sulfate glucosamine 3-o-sulfotransferase 5 [Plakobranchus ocellatus]|uniref:Heparan sulfate glucosamine 3-o-sulfotransferase 5 n=1 Tax=Plakobranchus ocellatus TaxID=259542 RepID=A0AAV4A8I6_9GAST|nr:heparan sulfate glucosamine 3-o-sulfotransferase 5 [Plakobranchus ocellatus]
MKAKKCSIVLDDLSRSTGGNKRCWTLQSFRSGVRVPRWVLSAALGALLFLTVYHLRAIRERDRKVSMSAHTRDLSAKGRDSVEARLDLLKAAAENNHQDEAVEYPVKHMTAPDKPLTISHGSGEDKDEDENDEGDLVSDQKATKLTDDQIRMIDAAIDDMSENKKNLMHWLFEKYVLPGSPDALQAWSPDRDIKERPGYFRPGNWDWTMTKAGEYDPNLYSPPFGELPRQRFPQAIMIGSGHCGTRALLDFIQMHPHVVVAHSEVHFFDDQFNRGMEWYLGQMPYSFSNQITLEKSPSYVMYPNAAREVYAMNRDVRLLMVVKDPVVSLMSSFSRRNAGKKNYSYSFLTTVNGTTSVNSDLYIVARGMFFVHLKHWLRFFSKSQILVLDGGALVKDPITQIQTVERFLGIPPKLTSRNFFFNQTKGFYCMVPFTMRAPKCLGVNKGRPHVPLDPEVKTLLYNFYKPYNEQLFRFLGKRFDWEPKDTV